MAPERRGAADFGIFLAFAGMIAIGVCFVASASYVSGGRSLDNSFYYITRHLVYVLVSLGAFFVFCRLNPRTWQVLALPVLGIATILCLLVIFTPLGVEANGARRWLLVGPFSMQPSEMLKLGLILSLALWLSRPEGQARRVWPGFLVGIGVVLAAAGIVEMQRDLGTIIVIVLIGVSMLFAAGAHLRHIAAVVLVLTAAATVLILVQPYRMERIRAWQDPWKHKSDEGYQVVQSYYAFAEGSWHGAGLGQGAAKYYIPAPHTDFVFATVAEETGLFGALAVLTLFGWLGMAGSRAAAKAPNAFARLAAVGVTTYLCGQALLNIAVVTGLVPCTGVPLPFISYGGSSLVVAATAAALLFSLSRKTRRGAQEDPDEGIGDRRRNRRTYLPGSGRGRSTTGNRRRSPAPVRR